MDTIQEKASRLRAIIRDMERVAVAFSGGVDSSYLLALAVDVLGSSNVLALTADSPFVPQRERDTAVNVAALLGADHHLLPFDELANPAIIANPPLRCYHCKNARFGALLAYIARERPGWALIHGENADDRLDYRPGSRAADELGVRAPLAEAGLTKQEIRVLSRERGLPTWDHPAASCLATRFPYGTPLSLEALHRVDRAEQAVQDVTGLKQIRVRDHFPAARIEAPASEIARLAADVTREPLARAVIGAGYLYVSLDLVGYRMGSMNDSIEAK